MGKGFITSRYLPSVGTSLASVVTETLNADITLSVTSAPQTVIATATTRDVVITWPTAAPMEGLSVTVKAIVANGYKVRSAAHSGETIENSSSWRDLTQTGEAFTAVSDGGTNWAEIGSAGVAITPAAPPDAPNVLNTSTCTVHYYDEDGNEVPDGPFWGAKARIYLPKADANYPHLREIHWTLTGPSPETTIRENIIYQWQFPPAPTDLYLDVEWGGDWPRDTVDAVFAVSFPVKNDDHISASPFSPGDITVTPTPAPAQPTAVTALGNTPGGWNLTRDVGGQPWITFDYSWTCTHLVEATATWNEILAERSR